MRPLTASRVFLLGLVALVIVTVIGGYAWWWISEAHARTAIAMEVTHGGDPARAPAIMLQNGCAGCHQIPGVPMATGQVGPSLAKIKEQEFIAGRLVNTPENLERWVAHARDIDPHNAMPSTGLNDQQARDVVAYLYALP